MKRFLRKNCSKTCQLPLFNLFCSQSYASDISAMKLNKNGKPNCFKFKWARRACTYGANTDVISFQKKEWEVLITHEKYAQSNHGQAFWRFYILLFFCINSKIRRLSFELQVELYSIIISRSVVHIHPTFYTHDQSLYCWFSSG